MRMAQRVTQDQLCLDRPGGKQVVETGPLPDVVECRSLYFSLGTSLGDPAANDDAGPSIRGPG